MLSPATLVVLGFLLLVLALVLAFLVYTVVRYTPIIGRIFEEQPVLLPLRVAPEPDGEDVRFRTSDGLELSGTYYRAHTAARAGVIMFCPEYLSNRWSFQLYVGDLRNLGYDLFTFDFRNHGESASEPGYDPLQWVTEREVRDLQAALTYLKSRPDSDPAGCGLFGISRGGSAALCVAAQDPSVWGVITDGAFPTSGTMRAYMHRWAEIYVNRLALWRRFPAWTFSSVVVIVGWFGRIRSQRRLKCRFPSIERAVARLAPRPWLMIHGAKDTYIGPEIAQKLFAEAGEPKHQWIVPAARHNRCREVDPEAYREQLARFVRQYGPRRPIAASLEASAARAIEASSAQPHSDPASEHVSLAAARSSSSFGT